MSVVVIFVLLVPAKWLIRKIVSEMSYNMSSGMLNRTIHPGILYCVLPADGYCFQWRHAASCGSVLQALYTMLGRVLFLFLELQISLSVHVLQLDSPPNLRKDSFVSWLPQSAVSLGIRFSSNIAIFKSCLKTQLSHSLSVLYHCCPLSDSSDGH